MFNYIMIYLILLAFNFALSNLSLKAAYLLSSQCIDRAINKLRVADLTRKSSLQILFFF
jgi:hypothetical protein